MSPALTFADVAMQILLDAQHDTENPDNDKSPGNSAETRAAETRLGRRCARRSAGGLPGPRHGDGAARRQPARGNVRLRAYAYANGRRLNDVAADVVARKLVLEGDSE